MFEAWKEKLLRRQIEKHPEAHMTDMGRELRELLTSTHESEWEAAKTAPEREALDRLRLARVKGSAP